MAKDIAILAGGCFWCTEAVFLDVAGVERVESGYIGGSVPNPTYKQVCSGTTGHAEAIRVTYDPETISIAEILDVFGQAGYARKRDRASDLGREPPEVGSALFDPVMKMTPGYQRL